MRFVLRLLMSIAVALAIGFGLSYHALTDGRMFGAVSIGPWTTWPDVGAPTPNPYARAHITREAALQLGRSEGLQFTATTDTDGAALDRACTYRIVGRVPVSTFWTLSAVDGAFVNVGASESNGALRSSDIARAADGSLDIAVGTHLAAGNWLELSGAGPFTLVLTLYDTTALSGFSSAASSMPAITREGCA